MNDRQLHSLSKDNQEHKQQQLRLGIDIDGTITDPATFIPYLNTAFKKDLPFSAITQYDLSELYGITTAEFLSWLEKNEADIYAQARLAANALETLHQLYEQHTLLYISARHQRHQDLTQQWFTTLKVPYHHIELMGSHDKIEVAKKHHIDLFFEDKLDNANDLAEALKIPVILFNTPYNQGLTHSLIQRVKNWQEAHQYLLGL